MNMPPPLQEQVRHNLRAERATSPTPVTRAVAGLLGMLGRTLSRIALGSTPITNTLAVLANGHPANRVHELMPWIAVA